MLVTERFCSVWTRGPLTGGLWTIWRETEPAGCDLETIAMQLCASTDWINTTDAVWMSCCGLLLLWTGCCRAVPGFCFSETHDVELDQCVDVCTDDAGIIC